MPRMNTQSSWARQVSLSDGTWSLRNKHSIPSSTRWRRKRVTPKQRCASHITFLHEKLETLTITQPQMELRRLEDINCDKYIVSTELVEYGSGLAVTYDDGSITCYDTRTMVPFTGLDDSSTVTCLAQAGYQYPIEPSGMQHHVLL